MKKEHIYYVYILTNKRNNVFYIGVTNNLFFRSFQHKLKINPNSFAARYNINKLVYYEEYQFIQDAIQREKQVKGWNREWKINLIKEENSTLHDLFENMFRLINEIFDHLMFIPCGANVCRK